MSQRCEYANKTLRQMYRFNQDFLSNALRCYFTSLIISLHELNSISSPKSTFSHIRYAVVVVVVVVVVAVMFQPGVLFLSRLTARLVSAAVSTRVHRKGQTILLPPLVRSQVGRAAVRTRWRCQVPDTACQGQMAPRSELMDRERERERERESPSPSPSSVTERNTSSRSNQK